MTSFLTCLKRLVLFGHVYLQSRTALVFCCFILQVFQTRPPQASFSSYQRGHDGLAGLQSSLLGRPPKSRLEQSASRDNQTPLVGKTKTPGANQRYICNVACNKATNGKVNELYIRVDYKIQNQVEALFLSKMHSDSKRQI